MTANPPPAAPAVGPPSPSPVVAAQLAELRELEARHPAPTWDDVRPDWEWLYAECNAGHLFHLYGRFVAVCDGQVLDTDADELALRLRLARRHDRHPERFVISFLGDWREGA